MEFDESKPEPLVTSDTQNRTKFHPEEAPEGYRKDGFEPYTFFYKLLRNMNRGTHLRSEYNPRDIWHDPAWIRYCDNLAMYDAVSSQLDLVDEQKRRGRKHFKKLHLKHYSQPNDRGMGSVLAAFCVCAYVCKQDGCRTHPNQKQRDERFTKLMDSFGFDDRKFQKWYGRVENHIRSRQQNAKRPIGKRKPVERRGYIY